MQKKKKNTIWNGKACIRIRLGYDRDLELSEQEFEITMVNILRAFTEKWAVHKNAWIM